MDPHHGSGYDADGAEDDRDAVFPHGDSAWFGPGRGRPASDEGGSSHVTNRLGFDSLDLNGGGRWTGGGAYPDYLGEFNEVPPTAPRPIRVPARPMTQAGAGISPPWSHPHAPPPCDHWRRIQPAPASSTSGFLHGPWRLVPVAGCTNRVHESACSSWEEPHPAWTPILFGRCRRHRRRPSSSKTTSFLSIFHTVQALLWSPCSSCSGKYIVYAMSMLALVFNTHLGAQRQGKLVCKEHKSIL